MCRREHGHGQAYAFVRRPAVKLMAFNSFTRNSAKYMHHDMYANGTKQRSCAQSQCEPVHCLSSRVCTPAHTTCETDAPPLPIIRPNSDRSHGSGMANSHHSTKMDMMPSAIATNLPNQRLTRDL